MRESDSPNDLTFDEIVASDMAFDDIAERFDDETAVNVGIARDPDAQEWTVEDFSIVRPAIDIVPHIVEEHRRTLGKPSSPTKETVTQRLDAVIVSYLRESGRLASFGPVLQSPPS